MDEAIFAGRLFKTNKNNVWTIIIYGLFVVIFGLLAVIVLAENSTVQWICGASLLGVLIAIGISRKLAFNELDTKNIYIGRNAIAIGQEEHALSELSGVGIYVDAFYGFRFRVAGVGGVKSYQSSYGMDNWMHFHIGNTKHSYRFVIPNREAYFLLEDILAAWKSDGRIFAWKEAYGRAFVEKEMGFSPQSQNRV